MKLSAGVLLAVGVAAWFLRPHLESTPQIGNPESQPPQVREEDGVAVVHTTSAGDAGSIPVVTAQRFRQGVRFRNSQTVAVRNIEFNPATSTEEVSEFEYSVSFEITGVCGRQKNELYLSGNAPNGDIVIEKWVFETQRGTYFHRRTASGTSIGQPLSGIPSVQIGIEGGAYVPVASRTRPPRVAKLELLRTPALGKVWGIACDPEGRFLLFLAGTTDRKLYRLGPIAGGTQVSVLTSAQCPHLLNCDGISPFHSNSIGRVYQITASTGPMTDTSARTLFLDSNNDGQFESSQTLSYDAYVAAGYMSGFWLTDFLLDTQ